VLVIEPDHTAGRAVRGIDPIAVIDIQRILQKLRERGIGVDNGPQRSRDSGDYRQSVYINDGQIFRAGTPNELTRDEEVRVYLGENSGCRATQRAVADD
jgi:lipopolysaccharide export system ATP-binding protein